MSDEVLMNIHGERLPSYGRDSLRWRGQQVYVAMLKMFPGLARKVTGLRIGYEVALDVGDSIFISKVGRVFFNKATGQVFVLIFGTKD